MKKNLQIIEIEDKETKAGKPYSRIKSEDGWMACFDKKTIEELKKHIGKVCSVEVRESGEYSNIAKFYAVEEDDLKVPVVKPGVPVETRVAKHTMPKDPVGLAVEVFIALNEKIDTDDGTALMKGSIELVKQAQEAFN